MFFDPTGTETLVQDLNKADAGSLIIPWLFFAWLFGKKTNAPKTNNVVHTDVASAAPPPNWNNDDDDDDDDDYYDDESNFGGRQRMGRSNGNTPRNNQVQNSQVDDIVQKTGLSDYGRRVLHNEITGKGLGYWEIMETAKQIAERGGKYVLWILEGN